MPTSPVAAESDAALEARAVAALREPDRVHLHMPVDVRSASLALLAVLASLFVLQWAGEFFIPLMLGLIFSYALAPVADALQRLRVPRALAAALLVVGMVGAVAWTTYSLADDATAFVDALPDAVQQIRRTVREARSQPDSTLDKVQKAAAQLEQVAEEGVVAPRVERGVTRVQIERPGFDVQQFLLDRMPTLTTGIAQAVMVVFITFFLLAAGDVFRRKIVRLAGPTFARRKLTVQALDEINAQIQRYLLVQVVVSVLVGVATWLAYMALDVRYAAVWGVMAFALNFVPYIGAIAVVGGSALVGFVQFGSTDMALMVGGVALGLHIVSGYLVMPWLTSRASRMNAVAVFVGVFAFGWLWGMWGLILGMPILLMVKAVCDRVDEFRIVAEFLDA